MKPTVGESLELDIYSYVRAGFLAVNIGSSGETHWRGTAGGYTACARFRIDTRAGRKPQLWLTFTVDGVPVDQCVDLRRTPQPLGNSRWWFTCPLTGKNCQKLFLPAGAKLFASQQGYRLAYECQRESAFTRTIRRANKITSNLQPGATIWGDFPERPRGMWRRTYDRLHDVYWESIAAALQAAKGTAGTLSLAQTTSERPRVCQNLEPS